MKTPFLVRSGRPSLAYDQDPGAADRPAILFLGGFRSDRTGTKATFLRDFSRRHGFCFTRFDYSGHGESEGAFADGTIESWRDDALDILDRVVPPGPVVLVGSSMGGWIGLLATLARPGRIAAFIGIAAAPDFTRDIVGIKASDAQRAFYSDHGYIEVPNEYSPEPYIMTRALIESGNRCCLLGTIHTTDTPAYLLQGGLDTEVDPGMPERIRACFPQAVKEITIISDGDHSLSRPQDLLMLGKVLISACT